MSHDVYVGDFGVLFNLCFSRIDGLLVDCFDRVGLITKRSSHVRVQFLAYNLKIPFEKVQSSFEDTSFK
jgi:hypothetical protein